MTILLTGPQGSGKTTLVTRVAATLRASGLQVAGLVQPVCWRDGTRAGYDVEDLTSGRRVPLCRLQDVSERPSGPTTGPYVFDRAAIEGGVQALRGPHDPCTVIILDEVGPLEVAGHGWAPALDLLVQHHPGPKLLVVREALIGVVTHRWGGDEVRVVRMGVDDEQAVVQALLDASGEAGRPTDPANR